MLQNWIFLKHFQKVANDRAQEEYCASAGEVELIFQSDSKLDSNIKCHFDLRSRCHVTIW